MNRKFICIIVPFIVLLIMFFSFSKINIVSADSGWDTDYDSGSSWDSDSGWDYDRDYDYDSDDKEYSSNQSHTGNNISDEEIRKITIYTILLFAGVGVILFILLLIYNRVLQPLVDRIYDLIFNGGKTSKSSNVKIVYRPFKYRQISQERANKIIPNFDIEKFNFEVYETFYNIQMAWMNFDADKLKELLTDELYNTYVMDLEALSVKNQRNTMMAFDLVDVKLIGLKKQNHQYIADVALNVKFYDYIEDINTLDVVRGTDKKRVDNTYILTFVKSVNNNKKDTCTQCGAKVEGNATGICEYCGSKLIFNSYNWVMSKKKIVCQRWE